MSAHGNHIVERCPAEIVERLTVLPGYIHSDFLHDLYSDRIQTMLFNSRRVHIETGFTKCASETFRHLTSAGIAGTKKEHACSLRHSGLRHALGPCSIRCPESSARSGRREPYRRPVPKKGENHCHDNAPERETDADMTERAAKAIVDNDRSTPGEDQTESPDRFCEELVAVHRRILAGRPLKNQPQFVLSESLLAPYLRRIQKR